jgi:hypothetical protein
MMFSIIEHIEYLMMRHDCVVVPGWGAFIANYSVSSYDEGASLLTRPHRAIGFNASVNHNDGLLVQSLMRREGLSYDEAMRFIADSVTTFRQQLAMDGEVSMGRLGYYRRNQGQHIEFVPFDKSNACDQYYGLEDLPIKTVTVLEQERADLEATSRRAIVPQERNLFSRKAVQIAASIAALIGLGIMLTTPIIVDRDHHDMATMTPTVTAPQAQQLGGVTVQQGVQSLGIGPVEAYPGIAATGNGAGKYYMVIATLRDQQELDSFKSSYPDLVPHMKMLDYKGMMCVYVARSDDYSQLMGLCSELPERLRDVWIYN